MRKLVWVLVLLLLLCGCAQNKESPPIEPEEITANVTLYYGDANNEKLVSEERQITFQEEEDRYKAALQALIAGPETAGFTRNIPAGTKVYGTMRQDNALLVNLTEHFLSFGGSVAEIIAVASVVNTLTESAEIEKVKILIEGSELIGPSGEARGFMTHFTADGGSPTAEEEVTLYFANPQATALIPEKRTLSFALSADLADRLRIVLAELIRGPQGNNLAPTIPAEVQVHSVSMQDGIAVVDFSPEMHTKHSGGAAGETMTITSIVNTLTEFEGVDLVAITVDGKPLNIEHVILDAPVERNEEIVEEQSE